MNSSLPSSLHFIKKHSLLIEDLSSSHPISNLNFISKILERIIHNRLNQHLTSFPSLSPFQSAYRKFHSSETALLRIYNDLLPQLANTNFLLWYFLIFLPPSTLLIIIFFYLASLLTLVSPIPHFLSSHLNFPIALSLFPFNLTSLILLPSPLASLRIDSLVLFSCA